MADYFTMLYTCWVNFTPIPTKMTHQKSFFEVLDGSVWGTSIQYVTEESKSSYQHTKQYNCLKSQKTWHQKWTSLHLFGRKERYWQMPWLNPFEAHFVFFCLTTYTKKGWRNTKAATAKARCREAMWSERSLNACETSLIRHGTTSLHTDDRNTTFTNMQQVFEWVFLRFLFLNYYYCCCFKRGNR